MNNEKSITEFIKLNPTPTVTVPLDKIFRNIFNPSKKDKTVRRITEDKRNQIKSVVTFETLKGSLNQFDKFVFCAAISEFRADNNFFTIRRLWRRMGGGYNLPAEMKNLIADSIEKLACTRLTVDLTDINNKIHYSDHKVIFRDYLLPCRSAEVKINGQIVAGAFQISSKSPLFQSTEIKKQFTEQPVELLDVPKLKNTETVMKLKFFLLERITAILGSHKKHKAHIVGKQKGGGFIFKRATKLHKIITFEDIFEQCELMDATKRQQQQARETISKILNHFLAQNCIFEWHFEKKNGKFYSIEFNNHAT